VRFQCAAPSGPDAEAVDSPTAGSSTSVAQADVPDPALAPAGTNPAASGGTSLLNANSLSGAGLLGAGAVGNALSPTTQPAPAADATPATAADISPSAQPLCSATYGVNPGGSFTTLSLPALVSPSDTSVTPPQPTFLLR
jgi:hypothetical protein